MPAENADCEYDQNVVCREFGGRSVNLALWLTCLCVFSLLIDLVPRSRLSERSTSAGILLTEGDRAQHLISLALSSVRIRAAPFVYSQ